MNTPHRSRAALTAAALLTTALTVGGCDKASGKYVADDNDTATFVFHSGKLDITENHGSGKDKREETIELPYETDGDRVLIHAMIFGMGANPVPTGEKGGGMVLTVQDNGDITGFPGVKTLRKIKE